MNQTRRSFLAGTATLPFLAELYTPPHVVGNQNGYTFIDLNALAGFKDVSFVDVRGINNRGQVLCTIRNHTPFSYDEGRLTYLFPQQNEVENSRTTATGINDAGQIVGCRLGNQSDPQLDSAFLYSNGQAMRLTGMKAAWGINTTLKIVSRIR